MSNENTKEKVIAIPTTKKQRFVGVKELVDPATGEVFPMQIQTIEDRDFNFHKIWLQHFVNSLDGIANQKLRLAFWIIDNLDKENKLVKTQRTIAKESGISYETVNRTLQALCESEDGSIPFLQKIQSGAYRVNPEIIFKGSHHNRMGIVYEYTLTNTTNNENRQQKEIIEDESLPEETELYQLQIPGTALASE